MFFKNLRVYRLPAPWNKTADQLLAELASQSFVPASSNDLLRRGWAAPREDGQLVHAVAGQFLLLLQTETKLLPASVINQVATAKAAELEESQGFAPGKKAMKELKERVADELLPRAFSVLSRTNVWIDPVNGWLVVDSASPSRADDAIKMLLKAVDRMPLESLRVQRSAVAVMTAWLEADEAPVGFTVDQDATMRATGESRASISYKRHALECDDLRRHIAAGKQCTRLAMTWNDKVSFVLDETLAIKSVRALDVLKENDASTRNDSERFDNDMVLMTGELAKLLADLVEALGGEAGDLVSPAGPVAGPARGDEPVCEQAPVGQRKLERAVGLTAELYKVREMHHEILGELYGDTVKLAIDRVRERMAAAGEGAIKAAIELANAMPVGSSAAQLFLVAAVEIMEPSPPAATDGSGTDPLYEQAVGIVRANQRASISLVQRHLRIGYNRAARLMDSMENQGVVSAMQSNGNRDIVNLEQNR